MNYYVVVEWHILYDYDTLYGKKLINKFTNKS